MTDGLVTALEKDGYPSREACLADSELERVAADCDLLFTTMARFASPEVKREVLAVLLRERLGAVVNWNGDVLATLRHYEAEVGRLEEARKEVAAERHWLMEQEAREAPFAALGREMATMFGLSEGCKSVTVGRNVSFVAPALAALAKEAGPKAHTGPSGWMYEAPRNGGDLWRLRREGSMHYFKSEDDPMIPPIDRAFVAALLKGVTP